MTNLAGKAYTLGMKRTTNEYATIRDARDALSKCASKMDAIIEWFEANDDTSGDSDLHKFFHDACYEIDSLRADMQVALNDAEVD